MKQNWQLVPDFSGEVMNLPVDSRSGLRDNDVSEVIVLLQSVHCPPVAQLDRATIDKAPLVKWI